MAGITSTLSHAGGPLIALFLLPQKLDKRIFVGTAVTYFFFGNAVKLIPYRFQGMFTVPRAWTSAVLLPAVVVGTLVGVLLQRKFSGRAFALAKHGFVKRLHPEPGLLVPDRPEAHDDGSSPRYLESPLQPEHAFARLDLAQAVLSACESADFTFLLNTTGLSKGNLSAHLSKLRDAGYVQITKSFRGNYPHTTCSLTKQGRRAFDDYRKQYLAVAKQLQKQG